MKNRKVYAIDLDDTLCKGQFRGEWEPEPFLGRVEKVNNLYKQGNIILICTARNPQWYAVTLAWLIKYWVMFHWLNCQYKSWYDCLIDDKNIYSNDFFNDNINDLDFYKK